jgi:negative regulator of flagellin synthesis FlgM
MVFQMRIQEPNRTGMINAYNKTGQTPVGKGRKLSMGKDEVNISAEALEMLKQVEDPDSPARREKIQRLKKQVEDGTYRVPSDKLADKILSFWRKL